MNKAKLVILFLYTIIIVLVTIYITSNYIHSRNSEAMKVLSDSLNKEINYFVEERAKLILDNMNLREQILTNETAVKIQKVYYEKKKKEILNQNSNEDYNQVIKYLDTLTIK